MEPDDTNTWLVAKRIVTCALVCLAAPAPLRAQVLTAGARVRVTLVSWPAAELGKRYEDGDRYRRFEGRLVSIAPDSIAVNPEPRRSGEGDVWRIPRANVYRLEVARGRRRLTVAGLGYGAAIGAVIGIAVGLITHPGAVLVAGEKSPCGATAPFGSAARCGVAGALVGGAVGAAVGAGASRPVWVEVHERWTNVSLALAVP